MPTIVTLTLNPALDLTTRTARVEPTTKLRCDVPRWDPGGGGINVARVILTLGGDCLTVYPAGGPPGERLGQALDRLGVPHLPVPIPSDTRESFTVDEASSGQQYRFVLPGPPLSEVDRANCLARIATLAPPPAYLVVSGSWPPGVPVTFFDELLDFCRARGTRLVFDGSGEPLRHAATRGGLHLLKPSLDELASLLGQTPLEADAQERAVARLVADGVAEIVVLSLGAEGAVLAHAGGVQRFAPFRVPVRSAVGAGDSMVAAIVLALFRGWSIPQAVRYGMAAGAASLMSPGTGLCEREAVERLYAEASVLDAE